MLKVLSLAALLLLGCAGRMHGPEINTVTCLGWAGSGESRIITVEALAPPEFICSERICYGTSGMCYYGCPESEMPAFCEHYK